MKNSSFILMGLVLLLANLAKGQTYTLSQSVLQSKGVKYLYYTSTSPRPEQIHVLEIDLADPTVKIQCTKASDIISGAKMTVKQMAAAKDNNGNYHNVIGAINGDFAYAPDENPHNYFVGDGQLLRTVRDDTAKSLFAITDDNTPFIGLGLLNFSATVAKGASQWNIDSLNRTRGSNQLVMYNQWIGSSTGTSGTGTEVKIALASGASWKANAPVACTVVSKVAGSGNMSFSAGQAVLSGTGTAATFLNTLNVGDAITITYNVSASGTAFSQVMGGFPRIVANGVKVDSASIMNEGGNYAQDSISDNPHTGIGISQDGKTLYLAVVDGRNPASRYGMSLKQFADFFIFLGAYNAINTDGGGSSTLVANNVVKNVPSDGSERLLTSALLVYTRERLLDDFEANEGHFDQAPTYAGGTQYTVGISTTSTMDRVTTSSCSGTASERAVLNDDAGSSSPWTVRLLSGSGVPANNVAIESTGTLGFWMKTSTAQPGATVQIWMDDTDGAEASPPLTILNDGQWHQYNFDLANFNGTTVTTGNGQLDGATVTLDAIVLKQPNTSTQWTVYFDDVNHDKLGSGTNVKSQNLSLDDFEAGVGHFDQKPTNTAGTQYTVGISTSSTLQRVTTDKHRGVGGLEAKLIDSSSSSNWTVRLMSGSGIPSNNTKITSDGTLSFWMKTSTANTGATVQVWFDDSDGAEASPAINVINDGQWHLYNFNLDNFNGTTITTGNGQLDAAEVTLDAIVLKQPNTSSTWTVDFDDVMHLCSGANPGTGTSVRRMEPQTPPVATDDQVRLYPNPNGGDFRINLPGDATDRYSIAIYTTSGARVFTGQYGGGAQDIHAARLSSGVYAVMVKGKKYKKTFRIIIRK